MAIQFQDASHGPTHIPSCDARDALPSCDARDALPSCDAHASCDAHDAPSRDAHDAPSRDAHIPPLYPPKTPPRHLQLMDLPPELHLQIARYLIYPDALSLKHASRYFYDSVDTGVALKVDWLMARRRLHLDCPNNTRCDLGSDLRFCRGSVPLLMRRRREHMECETRPDLGCLVYGTPACVHRRRGLRCWLRRRLTVEAWWVLLAVVALILSWVLAEFVL